MTRHHPFALLNARLVDPAAGYDGPGGVLVRDGAILASGPAVTPAAAGSEFAIQDCAGQLLIPGVIDARARVSALAGPQGETLASLSAGAIAGGVTTVCVQPDAGQILDSPEALAAFRAEAGLTQARLLPAAAATRGLDGRMLAEIGLLGLAGAAFFSTGESAIADSGLMRLALQATSMIDRRLASRPMEAGLGGAMNAGDLAARLGIAGAPPEGEAIGLYRDLALAEATGGALLVDQVSTERAVRLLERARGREVDACASVSIAHLAFCEIDLAELRTDLKLSPPLRTPEDRDALIEAVREGAIDMIVSAHAPKSAADAARPFARAPFGAAGIETLLIGALELWHNGALELIEVVRALTLGPALALGLPQGRLTPGAPADLALLDPGFPHVVPAAPRACRSAANPYAGRRMQGAILGVWVGGVRVGV
jgi:dihydroorotase